MTHRDPLSVPPGRREVAVDAVHRRDFSTPSDGSLRGPKRRLSRAFGLRHARLAMPRIAAPDVPCRKPRQAVSMSHYLCSLVFMYRSCLCGWAGAD